jgi:hypothetical protein
MPITVKSTGGGSVTLTAASTASDYTLTMPAQTGTIYATTGGAIQPSDGGTGQTSLTANNVLLGNGTSAVQFVAPGTTGNVLTSNGTTWTSSSAPAGLTLLATLTTTSGATQSATGLATTYTNFVVVCNGVQASSSAIIYVAASATNGSAYGADVSLYPSGTPSAMYGRLEIYQVGASITNHPINRAPTNAVLANDAYVATDVSGAINALRFSTGAGTFSAGTILIYGWK